MTILEGDIQVMLSQVLADVPEGGGAATGTPMTDGVSNNLFPDISELDRVYGDVALRKVFPAVRTENTDTYFGAHVIVADPPDDPDVSVVLFSTGNAFDVRSDATTRIEAYLTQGARYSGLLYGNHITGQAVITLIQRETADLPPVGTTLVLRKAEGLSSQTEQFVRVTDVDSVVHEFDDGLASEPFKRRVVTCQISDQLRYDFPGFEAVRYDATIDFTGRTKLYNTLVADAARYYGVVKSTAAAALGDFIVQAEGIFSQLVPSARAETPIADARTNQRSAALVPGANGAVALSLVLNFSPAAPIYVGGGILPGTLVVSRSGTTLTDVGGVLQINSSGTAVGTVDYANGVLALAQQVGSVSDVTNISYIPAGVPTVVNESFGIPVTQTSQRLSYVMTLTPAPAKASLQVSYLAQGRWYVLQEDGSGALRGGTPSVGAGSLNFTTGTVTITLGALPDVGSRIIFAWASRAGASVISASGDARFYFLHTLYRAIKPGTLVVTWNDGVARSATDSNGLLIGDATGPVAYSYGGVTLSPNTLPAKGTPITFTILSSVANAGTITTLTSSGANWTASLPTPIRALSVELAVVMEAPVRQYPGVDETVKSLLRVYDNGTGDLLITNQTGTLAVGTIDYGTGVVTLAKSVASFKSVQGVWTTATPLAGGPARVVFTGTEVRTQTISILNGPGADVLTNPEWAWWTGAQTVAANTRYAGADSSSYSVTVPMDSLRIAKYTLWKV
jgi:hypothetical protein